MKRLLVAVLLLAASLFPSSAAAQYDYSMEFAFFYPEGHFGPTDRGCSIAPNAFMISLNMYVTPYAPAASFIVHDGRTVSADGSPVPGEAGCVTETIVLFNEFDTATFEFEINDIQAGPSLINLGTITWDELPEYGRGPEPTIYILTGESIATGTAEPFVPGDPSDSTPEPTPDYVATIEAQQQEIEDLKATIEALEP